MWQLLVTDPRVLSSGRFSPRLPLEKGCWSPPFPWELRLDAYAGPAAQEERAAGCGRLWLVTSPRGLSVGVRMGQLPRPAAESSGLSPDSLPSGPPLPHSVPTGPLPPAASPPVMKPVPSTRPCPRAQPSFSQTGQWHRSRSTGNVRQVGFMPRQRVCALFSREILGTWDGHYGCPNENLFASISLIFK